MAFFEAMLVGTCDVIVVLFLDGILLFKDNPLQRGSKDRAINSASLVMRDNKTCLEHISRIF